MAGASDTVDRHASKKPLVIFSPWAPSENGIATYVGELMPYHMEEFDVTLVVADDAPVPAETRSGPRILFASEFGKHRSFFEDAPKLYHVGNNPDHSHMLDFLPRDPGIVVLHDYNLNYMHDAYTLGWREKKGYASVLQSEYGLLGAGNARWNFEKADRGLFATYTLTLNGDVLEAATGVIAHSRYVQYKVAARAPHIPIWHVPHHLSPEVEAYRGLDKRRARAELGLSQSEILVTALGFVTFAKRIPILLGALARLRGTVPPFRLILAGQRKPGEYDVDRDIEASGLSDLALCTDYIDEDSFFKHLAACDIVSNLRHPSGGETSGTLIRALGMGAPTVVLDTGPFGELPDSIVRKIPWNERAEENLADVLRGLMTNAAERRALGERASHFIRTEHNIRAIAERYAAIIRNVPPRQIRAEHKPFAQHFPNARETARRISALGETAAKKAHAASGAIWWKSAAIPLGQEGRRALIVAEEPAPTAELLSNLFAWPMESITAMTQEEFLAAELRETSGENIPLHSFTLAVAVVGSALAEDSACLLLRRLNGALRKGGRLALEMVAAAQSSDRDAILSEANLHGRLVDAGFWNVRQLETQDGIFADLLMPGYDETAEYQFACFAARKASDYAVWRFANSVTGLPFRTGGRIN
jgi:glycosyltransferase involved in cell wall biosynthesis